MGHRHLGAFPLASIQVNFLIVGVDYFKKWIEVEVVSKIIAEKVRCFYWKQIMYRFDLLGGVISTMVLYFLVSLWSLFIVT